MPVQPAFHQGPEGGAGKFRVLGTGALQLAVVVSGGRRVGACGAVSAQFAADCGRGSAELFGDGAHRGAEPAQVCDQHSLAELQEAAGGVSWCGLRWDAVGLAADRDTGSACHAENSACLGVGHPSRVNCQYRFSAAR